MESASSKTLFRIVSKLYKVPCTGVSLFYMRSVIRCRHDSKFLIKSPGQSLVATRNRLLSNVVKPLSMFQL